MIETDVEDTIRDIDIDDELEPLTDRETVEPGDLVKQIKNPGPFGDPANETDIDRLGRVTEVVTETRDLGMGRTRDDEIAMIETESGGEARMATAQVNSSLNEEGFGETLIPLRERGGTPPDFAGRSGGFRGVSSPTDIGREPDGEFDRPDTAPNIDPAPISRNTKTGEFGLDPLAITGGRVGRSVDLLREQEEAIDDDILGDLE